MSGHRVVKQTAAVALVATLAACTGASPAAPTMVPTVRAVATQVAPQANAAAPTAAAAATRVAPQVNAAAPTAAAVATQIGPTVVPAAGTAVAASPVKITDVEVKPNDVTLTLANEGAAPVDVSGFVVRVGSVNAKLPANAEIRPGGSLILHTAPGTSSGNDVYLGAEASQLLSALRPGATVELSTPQGATVTRFQLPA